MIRMPDKVKMLAMVLITVALLGVTTPVCAMPACDDTATGSCSDFIPACDDCPDTVVMKHTHDDAIAAPAPAPTASAVVADLLAVADVAPIGRPLATPTATASPPPLDPLGVRLTV